MDFFLVNFANKYEVFRYNFAKIRIQIKSQRYRFKGWKLEAENANKALWWNIMKTKYDRDMQWILWPVILEARINIAVWRQT